MQAGKMIKAHEWSWARFFSCNTNYQARGLCLIPSPPWRAPCSRVSPLLFRCIVIQVFFLQNPSFFPINLWTYLSFQLWLLTQKQELIKPNSYIHIQRWLSPWLYWLRRGKHYPHQGPVCVHPERLSLCRPLCLRLLRKYQLLTISQLNQRKRKKREQGRKEN